MEQATMPALIRSPDHSPPLLDLFLAGKKPSTLRNYRTSLEAFRAFLRVETVGEACQALLSQGPGHGNALALGFRNHLRDRGLSPGTVNVRLAALRSVVKLARTLGMVSWHLEVSGVKTKSFRDTRGPGTGGTQAVLHLLRGRGDAKGSRDAALLRCLFDLALRRGEAVALDLEHVDLQAGTVSILGKGREDRELLTLPEPTRRALQKWLFHRGWEPGPLFTNFDRAGKGGRLTGRSVARILKAAGEAAGLSRPVRPHGLRHAAITAALDAGLPLRDAQRYARHADPRTTTIYDDNRLDLAGKAAATVAAGLD